MSFILGTKDITVSQLLTIQAITATGNSSSIDLKGVAAANNMHEMRVHINIGVVTGTTPTLTVQMQDSPDNSAWTNVANAVTGTLNASGATDLYYRSVNRYQRAVLTVGGTSPSFTMAIDLYTPNRIT